jgi:hypothetical protein
MTKGQNKRTNVRRMRRHLKNTEFVTKLGMGVHRRGYGSGSSNEDYGSNAYKASESDE